MCSSDLHAPANGTSIFSGRQCGVPTLFEKSVPGRRAGSLPVLDVPPVNLDDVIPAGERRHALPLPELSELDVVRHFTRLSKRNYSIESEFYPLGSCTMKYNPKVDETVAALSGFRNLHPLQPESTVQGALHVLHHIQAQLGEITGLPGVSTQPVAGAHGELTGILMVRAYHLDRKSTRLNSSH